MDYSKVGRNRVYNLALEEQIQPDRFYPKNNLQTTMISSYTRLFQLLEKHPKQINRSVSPLPLLSDKLWRAFLAKPLTF